MLVHDAHLSKCVQHVEECVVGHAGCLRQVVVREGPSRILAEVLQDGLDTLLCLAENLRQLDNLAVRGEDGRHEQNDTSRPVGLAR